MQNHHAAPIGYCQCGCGKRTPIAKQTDNRRGHIKGQPKRYCSGHGTRRNEQQLEVFFWSYVEKKGDDECWIWTGPKSIEGYGAFQCAKVKYSAHRLSYAIAFGPIKDDLWVLHRCDNPSCCNPKHLFLGTHEDNMADMVSKGRGRALKGENHPTAVLSEYQIREARRLFQKRHPEFGYAGLGRRYGVSGKTICHALNGRSWTHI